MIETEALTKRYAEVTALSECHLTVPQGEVFGLLGPNGAGKSTLLRLLLGFLNPTTGTASIDGLDCHRQRVAVHKIVSYLPGDARLDRMMRGRSLLRLFCDFREKGTLERGMQLAERMELDMNRWVGLMSTGMRQKLALAICWAPATPVVILDEPTANLDPTVRGCVLELILEAKSEGRTVVFSSHVLSEIEAVCDQVGILRRGELVYQAPMAQINQLYRIRARLLGALPVLPDDLKQSVSIEQQANMLQIEASGDLSPLLKWLAEAPLTEIHVQPIGLRSVYDRIHHGGVVSGETEES